jgi:hypothetical protein
MSASYNGRWDTPERREGVSADASRTIENPLFCPLPLRTSRAVDRSNRFKVNRAPTCNCGDSPCQIQAMSIQPPPSVDTQNRPYVDI